MLEQSCWELLENDNFLQWLLHPDEASDRYWKYWMDNGPGRALFVKQSRDIIRLLEQSSSKVAKSALSNEILSRAIWSSIQEELQEKAHTTAPVVDIRSGTAYWWRVVVVFMILLAGEFLWMTSHRIDIHSSASSVEPFAINPVADKSLVICRNQSPLPQKIYLVDGSIVILEPRSMLSYPKLLRAKTREVTLKGNAFFEIAKDPNRPFLVRSGDLVTRVLGTSFRVIDDPGKEDVQVVVRTGKVSVYKEVDFDNGQPEFCVLLPHQEAVFHRKDRNLSFVPNADDQLIPPIAEEVPMNFDDVPVTGILAKLEDMYHIRILYNPDSLKECRLTTALQEEKLADKLDIICRAINATYRTQEDNIVIEGGHCAQ